MSGIAVCAVNLVCYGMWFAAVHLLLERKLSLAWTLGIELASFFPTFWLTMRLTSYVSAARTLLVILTFLVLVLLLYRGRWYRKLLVVFLVMMMLMLSEYLTASLVPPEQFRTGLESETFAYPPIVYAPYLFSQALLLAALVILGRRLQRRHAEELAASLPLLFLLFPASQLLLLIVWFRPIVSEGVLPDTGYTFLAVLFCVAADAGLAAAMSATAKSAELRAQNRYLEQQMQAQAAYGESLAARREQIRALREGVIAQSETIERLLQEGRGDEAARCAGSLQQSHGRGADQIAGCEHTVAASFLRHRAEELSAAGVALQWELHLPARLGVSNTDLICAFGNLLDNAAEACAGAEEKSLFLRAAFTPPYLSIETKNPLPAARRRKARRIPQLERGVGTAILRSLAEKYDGAFQAEAADGLFRASLILKEEADHAANRDL